jgi:hypothetical protein
VTWKEAPELSQQWTQRLSNAASNGCAGHCEEPCDHGTGANIQREKQRWLKNRYHWSCGEIRQRRDDG